MAAVATLLTDSLARFQSFLKDELTGLAVNLEQHTGNSSGDRSAWLGDVVHMLSKTYQQALAASLTRTQLLEPEAVQAVIAALQGGRSKQQQLSGGIAGDAGNGTDQQLAESNGAAHQAAGAGGAAEGRSSSSQEGTSAGGDTDPDTPANETRSQSWGKYTASIPSDAQDSLETTRAAEAGGDQASNAAAPHGSLIRTLLSNQAPAQQFDSQASSASSRSTSGDGASRGLNGLLPGHSSDGISPTAAAAAAAAATNNNLTSIGSGNAAGALYSDGDLLTNQVLQQYRDQFSTGTLPSGSNAAAVLSLANQRMSRANQQQQSQQQQQQQQFHNFGDHHGLSAPGVQGRMSMPGGDWSHSSGAGGAHGGGGGGTGHISGRLSESNLVLPQQFKDMHLGSAHSSRPVSPYSTDGGLTTVASTGGRMGAADMSNTNRSAQQQQQQQSEHASLTSAYAAAARQLAPSGPSSPQTSWLDSPPSHDSLQQGQGQGQQSSQHLDAATLLSLASLQQQQHLQFLHQGNNANANTGMDVSLNPEVGVPRALLNNASPEMLNLLQASGVNLGGGSDNTAQSNASAAAAALQAAGLLEGLSNFNTSSNSAAAGSGHAGGSQSGPLPRISNLGAMHSLQQQQQQQSRNSGQLPYQNAGYGQGGYGNQSDMYQSDPSFSLFGDRLFELQPIGQDSGSLPTSAQRTLNLFAAAAAAANGGGMQDGGMGGASSAPLNLGNPAFNAMNLGMLGGTDADLLDVSIGMHPHINAAAPSALSMASIGGLASLGSGGHSGTFGSAGMRLVSPRMSMSGLDSRTSPAGSGPSSPLPPRTADMPARFRVLPAAVQQRIVAVCRANPVISLRDFDDKVVNKLSLLVEAWGVGEALAMLDHLEQRMRTKQGVMKNGPGYLDVAVCSHLDMLKAQGSCPKTMKLEDYAMQVLSPPVFHELQQAVSSNRWLAWEHFDQGIIQLVKKLPRDSAVEKLQEITFHSFKNVDNIKGCIMSILNSKIREDRRRQ